MYIVSSQQSCLEELSTWRLWFTTLIPCPSSQRFLQQWKKVCLHSFFHGCENHCEGRPEYESNGLHCVTEQQGHSRFSNILASVYILISVYYGVKSWHYAGFHREYFGWAGKDVHNGTDLQMPRPLYTLDPCSSPIILVEAVGQRLLVVSYAVEPKWVANKILDSTKLLLHIQLISIVAEIICGGKLALGGFHRVPNPLYETLLFKYRLASQPMFVTKLGSFLASVPYSFCNSGV